MAVLTLKQFVTFINGAGGVGVLATILIGLAFVLPMRVDGPAAAIAYTATSTKPLMDTYSMVTASTTASAAQAAEEFTTTTTTKSQTDVFTVPFYSQFADISSPQWQKVACGIAAIGMLIDFYGDAVAPDILLEEGIAQNAYLSDAGWTHAGLIGLATARGLTGESISLAGYDKGEAFAILEQVLEEGPVMASVHYTFEPTNPIPHLVVINGVKDGLVYYNDPAEQAGGGWLTIEKFQAAWKQRYIAIRPAT